MGLFDSIGSAISSVTKSLGGLGNIASVGGDILGSVLGNNSARDIADQTNAFNAAQSAETRDWQERMRATQYQTAVADLKAAGLNPMLAYSQGGAGNLSGATASGVSAPVNVVQPSRGVASAAAAQQARQQVEQSKQQTLNIAADTANKQAQAKQINAQTALLVNQAMSEALRPDLLRAQTQTEWERPNLVSAQANSTRSLIGPTVANLRAQSGLSGASADQVRSQNMLFKSLNESDSPVIRNLGSVLQFFWR